MHIAYEILQALAALACTAEFVIQRWRDYKRSTDKVEGKARRQPGLTIRHTTLPATV